MPEQQYVQNIGLKGKQKSHIHHQYLSPKRITSPKIIISIRVKTMLISIRSEIMDQKKCNQEKCNIPEEEVIAFKELIKLQKQRIITIKAADKAAVIVILDFKDYMKSCYDHLLSSVPNNNDQEGTNPEMYYKLVNEFALEHAKTRILDTLNEALENQIITKQDFNAMNPEDKQPSKFYCNFKVHKETKHNEIPPVRPIVSGSGSITENISLLVEHRIKYASTKHALYLQDTPHFLRVIEKVNKGPQLPPNAILVTSDAIGAYHKIPQEDGIKCLE